MSGSEIADEDVDGGFGGGENHIQLELMAIEAALERIGPTKHPIVFLTRQKYIADYAKTLRANDFKKADMTEAANIGLWRRIEALDPDDAIEWRFAERDYDEMVEEWKNEKENAADKNRAISRDSI
jgi:ribonuclease HI